MSAAEFLCIFIVLFTIFILGRAEVYIVTVEGEPIISYRGGDNGFEATAVESDEKIDTTRYWRHHPLNSLSSLSAFGSQLDMSEHFLIIQPMVYWIELFLSGALANDISFLKMIFCLVNK